MDPKFFVAASIVRSSEGEKASEYIFHGRFNDGEQEGAEREVFSLFLREGVLLCVYNFFFGLFRDECV